MRLIASKVHRTRQPALTGCSSSSNRRPCVRMQHCAATPSDGEDLLDWTVFDSSIDSDDLGLPGFAVPSKSKKQAEELGKCYGCGVELQKESSRTPGFITESTFDVKTRHKQRNSILCSRCQALTHGEMVPAVRDFSYQQNLLMGEAQAEAQSPPTTDANEEDPNSTYTFKGDVLITPQQLREKLKVIRTTKAVCVLIVDILDTSGSFLARIRNLIAGNPIIVVATKVDLLPKNTNSKDVRDWLQDFVAFKSLNCLSVHLLSNKTGEGLDEACASILSQRLGRDVYIIGAANVGKSAFVRRMLREMANMTSRHFDAKATLVGKKLPVESAMPGTTLGLLKLGAFSSGGALYDTPGLHLHHRMLHMLTPAELKAIHPKRKLRPYVAAAPLHIAEQNTESNTSSQDSDGSEHHPAFGASCTYIWGALLRIDVLEAPADTRFVFFGTGHMQVYACRLFREDEILEFKQTQEGSVEERLVKGASGGVGVPGWDSTEDNSTFAAASVAARGGLRVARMAEIPTQDCVMTVADVTMSGMPGWVSVVSGSQGRVRLRVWAPKGVEVHLRPPIPCPTPLDVAPAW